MFLLAVDMSGSSDGGGIVSTYGVSGPNCRELTSSKITLLIRPEASFLRVPVVLVGRAGGAWLRTALLMDRTTPDTKLLNGLCGEDGEDATLLEPDTLARC
mmetsp:Transcript_10582/g.22946  ORF Transcript_10582/g.22946 Transcript_10582/m.22946 type:complete len:101 (-) Transcript_10582:742-1044(-)